GAARGARFGRPGAGRGWGPDGGGTWLRPRRGGAARARGPALTAEPLAAETAAEWGLIWKAVDDDRLIADAEALCARFATGPRLGLSLIKQALDAAEQNDLDAQLDFERDLQRKAGFHPDYAEGGRAVLEKGAPIFCGGGGGWGLPLA